MIYLSLFWTFFLIGAFTFGGGYAMLPLIQEQVTAKGWIDAESLVNFVAVSESTPGPFAVNMATYIGSVQGGIVGSITATCGVVLPSFLIILLIASVLKNLTESKYFKGFIRGVQPVVIALILSTGVILAFKAFGYVSPREFRVDFVSIIIFALLTGAWFLFRALFRRKLTAVQLILLSAALGIGVCLLAEHF